MSWADYIAIGLSIIALGMIGFILFSIGVIKGLHDAEKIFVSGANLGYADGKSGDTRGLQGKQSCCGEKRGCCGSGD